MIIYSLACTEHKVITMYYITSCLTCILIYIYYTHIHIYTQMATFLEIATQFIMSDFGIENIKCLYRQWLGASQGVFPC